MGRPSPALVVACVALFVALGGTGYAALQLPKNSVGPKQIQKGAVNRSDMANNAITGAKVKNRSLTNTDFRASSLPRGPRGPTGSRGPAGPAGGAPAYGYVAANGTLNTARTKGVASVSHIPGSGVYCIRVPGFSSASNVMTVDLDAQTSATAEPPPAAADWVGIVEVDYVPTAPCTVGHFEVRTLAQIFNGAGDHIGNAAADQAFTFVVP
jgi:hypothetical protein